MKFNYSVNGITLPSVDVVKDLGVMISSNLKFSEHVTCVTRKASRTCNFILRAFVSKNASVYTKLYNSLVLPVICYGSVVWSPGLKKDSDRLQRVQDRFLKRVEWRCNIPRCSLKLPLISEIFVKNDEKMMNIIVRDQAVVHDSSRLQIHLRDQRN